MRRTSLACLLAAASLALPAAAAAAGDRLPGHAIDAGGGASDEFRLDPTLIHESNMPGIVERDRMYMAARPGFRHKHIPLTFDAEGRPHAGGVYLFDTADDASEFSRWLSQEFALDGVLILQRPYFLDVEAYSYDVIGAHKFADVRTDVVFRSERWRTRGTGGERRLLRELWPSIRRTAWKRGYTSVWLLYNRAERLVNVVYFDDRAGEWDRTTPDFASHDALANARTMGAAFDRLGWEKQFDRTSWVLSTWFPALPGDAGEAAVWPNSPPFPHPSASDGVCVPSRGENAATAPADCTPDCGDAIWDDDEDNQRCPGDVPYTAASRR